MLDKEIKIKSNIHNHTKYCHHSNLEPEEVVIWAIENGFKEFTISDHIPYPKTHKNNSVLNEWDEISIKEFKKLQEQYSNEKFQLYIAVESEYYKKDHQYYKSFIDKYNLDFAIFGNHYYGSCMDKQILYSDLKDPYKATKKYVKQSISAFKSNLFIHMAHPDLIIRNYPLWDNKIIKMYKKLIKASIKYNVSLGFNVNGFWIKKVKNNPNNYPTDKFWKLVVNSKAKVRIEIDAHEKTILDPNLINQCFDYAIEIGLKNNLIDFILKK